MTPMPPGPAMLRGPARQPRIQMGMPQRCDSATSKVLSAQVRRTSASEIDANFPCGDPKTTQRKA